MRFYFYKNTITTSLDDLNEVPGFEELTEEQLEFYNNNPHAKAREVRKLQLEPTFEDKFAQLSLDDLRENRIKSLSNISLNVSEKHCPSYKISNALVSLESASSTYKIYPDDKSKTLLQEYRVNSQYLRNLYYEAVDALESCVSREEVESIYDLYVAKYDTYNWFTFNENE